MQQKIQSLKLEKTLELDITVQVELDCMKSIMNHDHQFGLQIHKLTSVSLIYMDEELNFRDRYMSSVYMYLDSEGTPMQQLPLPHKIYNHPQFEFYVS